MRACERGDKEGPARKSEELHDGREHADHGRRGDDCKAVAGEHLSQEYGEWCEQDGRQHEAVPEELQADPARPEAAQDVRGRAAEDVRVVEAPREQEEERVERERQEDEESACGAFYVHRAAVAAVRRSSGAVRPSKNARRSQVSNPKTSAPLPPKTANCSLTFVVIT